MGVTNLTVYDHDLVESHNLPNQFYRIEDLDKAKVVALYCLDRMMERLEKFINGLPRPLLEPIWYPGVPGDEIKGEELIVKLTEFLKGLAALLVESVKDEGFFEHNPVIRVVPRHQDASGIVIYYQGRKVFERWFSPFDLDWKNRQQAQTEMADWYAEIGDAQLLSSRLRGFNRLRGLERAHGQLHRRPRRLHGAQPLDGQPGGDGTNQAFPPDRSGPGPLRRVAGHPQTRSRRARGNHLPARPGLIARRCP